MIVASSSFRLNSFLLPLVICLVILMAIPSAISIDEETNPPDETPVDNTPAEEELSSWARLQISSNAMASMPYGTYRINIYEHQNNLMPGFNGTKRYFYAPIILLDHESAYSIYNNVTKEPQLRFRIEMWNLEVEKSVGEYVALLTDEIIKPHQVEIIPFDKVILSTSSSSSDYQLTKDWTPYQFHQSLWFTIICFSMRECDELAVVMQTTPEQFSHLKMFFSQSAQKTQRRETIIRVENIMAGEMAATLDQRYINPDTPDALLTAEDEKRLLTESSTNVLIDSFDDSDVVSPTTEAQIYNMLKDMLVSSREIIKDQSDQMWESVFWDDDNYRPDKTTRTWTEQYDSQSSEVQTKMETAFKDTDKWEKSHSIGANGAGFSKSVGTETTNEGSHSEEEIDKLWAESKDTVEWEGEKFTPKSMSLARVNMNTLRNTQTLEDRSVRVSYLTAVLSVALNFHPYTDKPSMDQLFYLQQQIDELKATDTQLKSVDAALNSSILEITPPKPVDGPMPTSCTNLKMMGHTQNGFYLIKSGTSQIKTSYCDFSKATGTAGYETVIGFNDLKTSSPGVSFYVQRESSYSSVLTVIPYEVEQLNIGGAMNLTSGIFTAPVNGRYHFSFTSYLYWSSFSSIDSSIVVYLRLKGVSIATSFAQLSGGSGGNVPIVATLNLAKGDTVDTYLGYSGSITGNIIKYIHFTGILLEEDLLL